MGKGKSRAEIVWGGRFGMLPQGTAASIGTLERWTAVAAANRARSRDD